MSSKSNTLESEILQYLFQNVAMTLPGSFYISLHKNPGPEETGNQQTNEVSTAEYENYARVAVARSAGGWAFTSPDQINPVAEIAFAVAGAASTGATATHFAIGENASGAGKVYYYGPIAPQIVIANGVQPKLTTQTQITED